MPAAAMETNAAVIGCGRIAHSLESDPLRYKPCTHIGALRELQKEHPLLKITALCDIKNENLNAAKEYVSGFQNSPRLYTDYRNLLETEPDILVISSTTDSHFDIMMAALKLNIPSIVVEKPVCIDNKEAAKLEKAAGTSKSRVWVNYERRHHPKYIKLKKILNSNEYGFPLYYRGLFMAPNKGLFSDKKSGSEGVLLHDTTHLLDLAMFLFGVPHTYSSHVSGNSNEMQTHTLLMEHSTELKGEIVTLTDASAFHFEMQMILENARITVGNGFFQIEKIKESSYYQNFRSFSGTKNKKEKKIKTHRNPFVRLYQKVLTGAATPEYLHNSTLNVKILSKR